jgi:prepilin-type N-terminal cleavage/methylation domain-containing protein
MPMTFRCRSISRRSSGGFTLTELIVAIVLAAIVASFIALFLGTPIDSYFAQTRRSDLADSADHIATAITVDLRTALPSSMRVAASGTALEFLATEGTARYYGPLDKSGAQTAEELTFAPSSVSSFVTLDNFNPPAAPYTFPYYPPYLSVGNLGIYNPGPNGDQDAYHNVYGAGGDVGVMTPAGNKVVKITGNPGGPGENLVTLNSPTPMKFVSNGLQNRDAYLVSGPVSYVCDLTPGSPSYGTLRRYSNYAVTALQQVPPANATVSLIAHDVSACAFSRPYQDPNHGFGEIAILRITLSSKGESFLLFLEAPTEYSQ